MGYMPWEDCRTCRFFDRGICRKEGGETSCSFYLQVNPSEAVNIYQEGEEKE